MNLENVKKKPKTTIRQFFTKTLPLFVQNFHGGWDALQKFVAFLLTIF